MNIGCDLVKKLLYGYYQIKTFLYECTEPAYKVIIGKTEKQENKLQISNLSNT